MCCKAQLRRKAMSNEIARLALVSLLLRMVFPGNVSHLTRYLQRDGLLHPKGA